MAAEKAYGNPMLRQLPLLFHTLRYLRFKQLFYQVFYRVKNKFVKERFTDSPLEIAPIQWETHLWSENSWKEKSFTFLNLQKSFDKIDWNFSNYGKLWTYNLTYFDFLNQRDVCVQDGIGLIMNFIDEEKKLKDAKEPYPISLRGVNWVKFLSRKQVQNKVVNKFLFNDYQRLCANLEFHILGNHLLENGFSLFFGAYFFKDEVLYRKSKKILRNQLKEQIMADGAHYELSPMYHQIVLYRLLDCIHLVQLNKWVGEELLELFYAKAQLMLGWLEKVTFNNGEIPRVNDSSKGVAPSTKNLLDYAEILKVYPQSVDLKSSGYRRLEMDKFEFLIDVGQISPSYQPAHSHADSLQFVFHYDNKPIIVDTGISTYEKNERRDIERSTSSHNTINIKGLNSSQVWSGFRIGKRAKVIILEDYSYTITASHNGYKALGFAHQRNFKIKENTFVLSDMLVSKKNESPRAVGHLHFHPDVHLKLVGNILFVNKELEISFKETDTLKLSEYQYAKGFNSLVTAMKIKYEISKNVQISVMEIEKKR